jgi:two-component system chemotaxis sensor kinase CheA
MDDLQRFKDTYITECYELLEDMEEKLLALDSDNPDNEDLNAIFRCAHSIKGGSGAFGLSRITGFTHILEELLDSMREGKLLPTRQVIDTLLASVDILNKMVGAAKNNTELEVGIEADVTAKLNVIVGKSGDVSHAKAEVVQEIALEEVSIFDISFKPHDNIFLSGNEPLLIIRELKGLGEFSATPDISKIPNIETIDPELCYTSWEFSLETEKTTENVKEAFEFVDGDCDLVIDKIAAFAKTVSNEKSAPIAEKAPSPAAMTSEPVKQQSATPAKPAADNDKDDGKSAAVSSIRVDIDKVDRLVNMVGELVITQAMIAAQSHKISFDEYPELVAGINSLSQHTRELQEAVMSVRMQPVKSVFSRMPRIVRDLSTQLGKDIRLEMYGEATELDRTVIEQLSDPLTHMIRNSVDHGIGTPQDRIEQGKPAQGVIKLSAEHAGGKIVLRISDDGQGINREKVLKKAKEKGLFAEDAQPSEFDIDNIVFMAGFSTAEVVSNISGRGVGMDVVKRNIEGLGGTINIINKPGKGTEFVVTLPLTLAILDGMIIRVGAEKYIIPIGNIIETMKPKPDEIRKIADANDLINVRGDFVAILYLHKVFAIQNAEQDPSRGLVVLVENGTEKFGLVVDELIGQQQVVIKSLEENSDAVSGISAATILGDGKVALILDISKLQSLMVKLEKAKAA